MTVSPLLSGFIHDSPELGPHRCPRPREEGGKCSTIDPTFISPNSVPVLCHALLSVKWPSNNTINNTVLIESLCSSRAEMPIFSPSCKGERGFREVKKLCRGHTADGSGRWDFNPGLWQAGPWSRGPPTRVGREPLRGSIDSDQAWPDWRVCLWTGHT